MRGENGIEFNPATAVIQMGALILGGMIAVAGLSVMLTKTDRDNAPSKGHER